MVVYDTAWFMKRIKEKRPNDYKDYIFKSPYINSHKYMKIEHLLCGNNYEVSPNAFLRGRGCPKCARNHITRTQMKTNEEFKKQLPNTIVAQEEYKGAFKKLKFYCKKCHNTFYKTPHDFLARKVCVYCTGNFRRDTESFKKELKSLSGSEYSLIGKYTSANEYITLRHNDCGNIYKVTPHNFRHGKRCPHCIMSHGERMVEKTLISLNIPYEVQKKFNDLVLSNPLSYDFYIPSSHLLIEYQGKQHYEPVTHFGGLDNFLIQEKRDARKRSYASNKGFRLLEIPYTIDKQLNINNLIKASL